MDWADLRYFLAVARSGSLSGAARGLGVNHSTVFRRLRAFEARLGVRLFDRLPSGHVPTAAGDEMLASAELVEEEIAALERRVTGLDLRLGGTVRATTTDTLAFGFLRPHLAAFAKAYPGIAVELVVDNQFFNLSKRQADVAIRPAPDPPENLVGRRLGALAYALYGTHAGPRDAAAAPWVGLDDSLAHLPPSRWLRKHVAVASVVFRANTYVAVAEAIAAGVGIGFLPCFLGDADPSLARIGDPHEEFEGELWLLTHEDLKHVAQVHAFLDFMADAIGAERDRLEGRRPSPTPSRRAP